MVGGRILEFRFYDDRVWFNVEGVGSEEGHRCGLFVKPSVVLERKNGPRPGDALWWQGDFAFWTPLQRGICLDHDRCQLGPCKVDVDLKLERIGFSGVENPDFPKENT